MLQKTEMILAKLSFGANCGIELALAVYFLHCFCFVLFFNAVISARITYNDHIYLVVTSPTKYFLIRFIVFE